MGNLGLDLSKIPIDILLNILNIVLLFIIVRTLAYKPIRKFMDARTARVNAAAEEAAQKAADADKAKAEYEAMLQNGEAEQQKLCEQARRSAESEAEQIVQNAKKQAEEILEKAKADAASAHDNALKDMQGEIVGLAFDISEKLLAHSVQDADTKKLADRLFESELNGGDNK